ncbi:MAG TPA: hypothetical protein VJ888_01445 [Mobilitalea sp.]|nr:hypothetical protein [Mobilitalea sp.]
MIRSMRKLNNQGSTLLTVIICIALIGILGSMMLSVTMTNLQMKIVERGAKENFYSCEVAMEEIKIGIEEIAAEQISTVYKEKIMNKFATYLSYTDEDARNKYIKNMVAIEILKQLGDVDVSMSESDLINGVIKIDDELSKFTGYPSEATVEVTIGSDPDTPSIYCTSIDVGSVSDVVEAVVIEDVSVKMTKNDYQTSITSNIVITLPNFTFDEDIVPGDPETTYHLVAPFEGYALLADGGIISDNNSGTSTVTGDVYAGEAGITVDSQVLESHALNINAKNIVTRGNITVEDTGKLVIRGMGTNIPLVWADNLVTRTTDMYMNSSYKTTMDIIGLCFIKDDLTLDGSNSVVEINGAYVGYSGTHTEKGSSIIINGTGSSMDLQGLNSLILAGRAHVSVDDPLKEADILTGESIAFKSNQKAYLIPGKFIENTNHNPVTQADLLANANIVPLVNFTSAEITDMLYSSYLSTPPMKIAAKQTIEGNVATLLRYYYLNFASGLKADQYLQEYLSRDPSALDVMEPFKLGQVKLPEESLNEVVCAGNKMSYNGLSVTLSQGISNAHISDEAADNEISGMLLDEAIYLSGDGFSNSYRVNQLDSLYSKMTHLLYLDSNRAYQETDKAIGSSLIPAGMSSISGYLTKYTELQYYSTTKTFESSDIDLTKLSCIIVDGDATLNSNFNGVLIASGDITINDDVTVNGMVVSIGTISPTGTSTGDIILEDRVIVNGRLVATSNILLGAGVNIAATDAVVLADINTIFTNYGEVLSKLFTNAEMTINYSIDQTAGVLVDMSALVSYENWRKN